jgi:hypothetical protein
MRAVASPREYHVSSPRPAARAATSVDQPKPWGADSGPRVRVVVLAEAVAADRLDEPRDDAVALAAEAQRLEAADQQPRGIDPARAAPRPPAGEARPGGGLLHRDGRDAAGGAVAPRVQQVLLGETDPHFVRGPDGEPFVAPWWMGTGSPVDFTSPAAEAWWREQAAGVLRLGVQGIKADDGEGFYLPDGVRFADGSTGAQSAWGHGLRYRRSMQRALDEVHPGEGVLFGRPGWTGQQGVGVTGAATRHRTSGRCARSSPPR